MSLGVAAQPATAAQSITTNKPQERIRMSRVSHGAAWIVNGCARGSTRTHATRERRASTTYKTSSCETAVYTTGVVRVSAIGAGRAARRGGRDREDRRRIRDDGWDHRWGLRSPGRRFGWTATRSALRTALRESRGSAR